MLPPAWIPAAGCHSPGMGKAGAGSVGLVYAARAGGGGLPDAQGRSSFASGPSSARAAGGGAYPGGLPGLLPDGDATYETEERSAGTDAERGFEVALDDSDGGRAHSHDGRARTGHAAAYRSGA